MRGWRPIPPAQADPDTLIIGDLNSYAKEDPITAIKSAGYTNLIESRLGADAYSYAFDGQWGYLDHALSSASLTPQVAGVAEWHINADEPAVLDYNTDFKSAGQISSLYAADPYRSTDHDPTIIGLDLATAAVSTPTGAPTAPTPTPAPGTQPGLRTPDWLAAALALLFAGAAIGVILLVRRRR